MQTNLVDAKIHFVTEIIFLFSFFLSFRSVCNSVARASPPNLFCLCTPICILTLNSWDVLKISRNQWVIYHIHIMIRTINHNNKAKSVEINIEKKNWIKRIVVTSSILFVAMVVNPMGNTVARSLISGFYQIVLLKNHPQKCFFFFWILNTFFTIFFSSICSFNTIWLMSLHLSFPRK